MQGEEEEVRQEVGILSTKTQDNKLNGMLDAIVNNTQAGQGGKAADSKAFMSRIHISNKLWFYEFLIP